MKKPSKKGMTAAKIVAGVAATLLMGCNINGCFGFNGSVYGPPPSDNDNPDVYGPPSIESDEETNDTKETDETYNSDNNMNEDVYGPPADDFDPDDNEVVCVYGPPESEK